jgi:hypothetical protein
MVDSHVSGESEDEGSRESEGIQLRLISQPYSYDLYRLYEWFILCSLLLL